MMSGVLNKLRDLEKRYAFRFGYIKEVDYSGSAEWNPNGYVPAAQVIVVDVTGIDDDLKEVLLPAARVAVTGASRDSGFWWPIESGLIVLVGFVDGFECPVVINTFWSDSHGTPPSGANGDKVIMKWGGHVFIMNRDTSAGGFSLVTANGVKILLREAGSAKTLRLEHPSGSSIEIQDDGSMEFISAGDLVQTIAGNFVATITGSATIRSTGPMTIQSDVSVKLKTVLPESGVITNLLYPRDYLTGLPILSSSSVEASS